ncbi:MAG: metal ABC transporter substrate-binding protein [Candidatus Woesearchaeota archaeon]
MKRLIYLAIITLLVSACASVQSEQSLEAEQEIVVGTTFFPYYELTRPLLADVGQVISVVPKTMDPHDFEPRIRELARLQTLSAYVKTGVEFEPFEEQIIESLPSQIPIIDAGASLSLLEYTGSHGHSHSHDDEHSSDHSHNESHSDSHSHDDEHSSDHHHDHTYDPHVWLSPKNALVIMQEIQSQLEIILPEHAQTIQENAAQFGQQLQELEQAYAQSLETCQKDTIIVAHNAYSYLARDYGFHTASISGLSHESEPSLRQIAQLIDVAREHNVTYVFFEEHVSSQVAQTIAREVGAQVESLNPLEVVFDDRTYIEIMYENLNKLAIALECE